MKALLKSLFSIYYKYIYYKSEYEPGFSLHVTFSLMKHSGALLINILCTEASECQTRWLSEIVPVGQVTERERLIKLSRPDFLFFT